jgi:type IV secretion system protein VirD4
MDKLSRLLTVVSVILLGCSLAMIVALGWPLTGLVLGLSAVNAFRQRRNRRGPLTTLGSARWAEFADLRAAGMIGHSSGLMLGHLIAKGPQHRAGRVRKLLSSRLRAEEACRSFWSWRMVSDAPVVSLPHAIHTSVFAPSGTGKGTSLVVPFLLNNCESAVVLDPKGENARLTAEHRRKHFGHRVVLLDLHKIVTNAPDSFNPLDAIDPADPFALDKCASLADALVVRAPDEREPHWSDSASIFIKSLLAMLVWYGKREDGTRSLNTLRDIVTNPQRLEMSIKLMQESTAWGGMLARFGGQLSSYVDKEKSSTLTTVSRHLKFLDTPAVAESMRTSGFYPADLRKGKMTVYLIVPPEHLRSLAGLTRTWVGSMLQAAMAGGTQETNKVHFILDEAATLGHLESIDDAVNISRGYGVRMQMYYQSLAQLKNTFPNGQEQTLLSNTTQVFFAVNDMVTAELVSSRLGEQTVVVASGGSNSGSSFQSSEGPHGSNSRGRSTGTSDNWGQQTRRLLKPEEVIALSPREAITFAAGVPPIRTRLVRWYETPLSPLSPLATARAEGALRRFIRASFVLTASGALFLASLILALGLLGTLVSRSQDPSQVAPIPPTRWQVDGR